MSVLTQVERRSVKGRAFFGLVFAALSVGAVSIVYPFLLMVAGALRSPMDAAEMDLVPDYLVNDQALGRKFLERKYNYDVQATNAYRGYQDYSFAQATIPDRVDTRQVQALCDFVESTAIPDHWWVLGGTRIYQRTTSPNNRRFIDLLRVRYDDQVGRLADELGVVIESWRNVQMQMPDWTSPRFNYDHSSFYDAYFELLRQRPLAERGFVSVSAAFLDNIVFSKYGKLNVDAYNQAHARPISSYRRFSVPRRLPGEDQPVLRAEWLTLVREVINVSFVRADVSDQAYQVFLKQKYGTIDELAAAWDQPDLHAWAEIHLPADSDWVPVARSRDYRAFLAALDPGRLYLVGPEFAWRDWLQATYGQPVDLPWAKEAGVTDWSEVPIPIADVEQAYVLANAWSLRWQFATSNFRDVFAEVMTQGRAFFNSVMFVVLAIATTLTIQPIAAYAMSRFTPPGTWRLILIFMATMAFPPMVGMIPQFLILRQLNLFNTFLALILPVIVNGYLIFLLKGFFDSIPHYLYEAALIDGASELRMFWEITMSLSKPILAVIALQTFTYAWMAFLYPLLVCPDESMHVLAVWLYQFQQDAPTTAVFAAILVTSIPTFVIFVLTQRTIMRGIAVPAEK